MLIFALGDLAMARLIDLTATLDPANRATLPPAMFGAAKVVAAAINRALC